MINKMRELITKENFDFMCYTNRHLIKGEIKGVATDLHGYCACDMRRYDKPLDEALGEAGILTVYPYYGPFAWSNTTTIAEIDRTVELAYEINGLDKDKVPFVITGHSMGGLTGLAYSYYTEHNPVACAVDCPVTDLIRLIEMRPDIYRSMITAFAHYDMPLEEAMKSVSPAHLVGKLPRISYLITAGTADTDVDYTQHCAKFVPQMREAGYDMSYHLEEGMKHCDMPDHVFKIFCDFVIKQVEDNRK